MKTYIAFKTELEGLNNVFDTVNAEEKIAASKVQILKNEILALNDYGEKLEKMMHSLSYFGDDKSHPLMKVRKSGKRTLLMISGDKGLVGGLWHKVVNKSLKIMDEYDDIVVFGIKGKKFLEEEGVEISKFFTAMYPHEENGDTIADYFFGQFIKGSVSHIDILYPQYVSISKQKPNVVRFLPFSFDKSDDVVAANAAADVSPAADMAAGIPIFEPSKKYIFNSLLNKYIKLFFYKIFSETSLSKFSARTVSMEHARVKTKELIKKNVQTYNKQRHRMLTQRQLISFGSHKNIN